MPWSPVGPVRRGIGRPGAEQGGEEGAGQERGEAGSEKEPLSQELWDEGVWAPRGRRVGSPGAAARRGEKETPKR